MPPGPPNRQQGAVAGLFRNGARLDPGQVTDVRMSPMMRTMFYEDGSNSYFQPDPFPGGIPHHTVPGYLPPGTYPPVPPSIPRRGAPKPGSSSGGGRQR